MFWLRTYLLRFVLGFHVCLEHKFAHSVLHTGVTDSAQQREVLLLAVKSELAGRKRDVLADAVSSLP